MAVSPAKEKANAANSKKQKDIKSLNGRQKAAIFLVAVGEEISAKIMEQMREDEIEKLVFEIARTETVESELKEAVLQEFQDLMAAQNFITTGGIDYARGLLEKSLGSQKAIEVINRLTSSLQVRPFDFIRRTDPAHLLNFIQQEHPQTIALILAYLEPQKASVILQNLPDEIQSDDAAGDCDVCCIGHERLLSRDRQRKVERDRKEPARGRGLGCAAGRAWRAPRFTLHAAQ